MKLVKVTDMDNRSMYFNVNVIEIVLMGVNDKRERCNGMKISTDKYSFAIKETAFELLEQEIVRQNFIDCLDENGDVMLINKAHIVSVLEVGLEGWALVTLDVKEKGYNNYYVREMAGFAVT